VTNFALLNIDDHQDLRIITDHAAKYGDNVMYAMTFPFEFRSIQAHYPIFFHRDDKGDYYPVALFGFKEGENLFLDESGWNADYIPAMIRREPFLIGYQGSEDQDEAGKARVMSIDMDHPRVSQDRGEAVFRPLGGRTPYLEDAATLMEEIYGGYVHNKTFVAALEEHELIESVTLGITLNDDSQNQLLGFFAINEEKVEQLPGSVLEQFSQQKILMPLFMILASTGNVRNLIEFRNQRLKDQQ
jgi:hypothetical protein